MRYKQLARVILNEFVILEEYDNLHECEKRFQDDVVHSICEYFKSCRLEMGGNDNETS